MSETLRGRSANRFLRVSKYVEADQNGDQAEKLRWLERKPLPRVNLAFQAASLPLRLQWSDREELRALKNGIELPYGIEEMSDGERAALILSAQAILAEDDAAILIDEPERHLHRAISAPLIAYLRRERPDLHWVIATNDLSLPRDDLAARALVLYDYNGELWRADLLDDIQNVHPKLAEAIYGARERVLFVEGTTTGLDRPLYQLLYPGVTIVPAGPRADVVNAVAGLSNVDGLHQMKARGLVDADNAMGRERLLRIGVYPLNLYAVESLWYHPVVITALLEGSGSTSSYEAVVEAACKSITPQQIEHLSIDAAYKEVRHKYDTSFPSFDEFKVNLSDRIEIDLDGQALTESKRKNIAAAVGASDWESVVLLVKIKASSAPGIIAQHLGYRSPSAYETAAQKLLQRDASVLIELRTKVPSPFAEHEVRSVAV